MGKPQERLEFSKYKVGDQLFNKVWQGIRTYKTYFWWRQSSR